MFTGRSEPRHSGAPLCNSWVPMQPFEGVFVPLTQVLLSFPKALGGQGHAASESASWAPVYCIGETLIKLLKLNTSWWLRPIIPVPRRLRQEDYCKFEAGLNYRVSSRDTSSMSQVSFLGELTPTCWWVQSVCFCVPMEGPSA